ncbi:MAG TPA: tRNA lysidine(34) synthetase TilS [Ktedonobacteraceae bacterium]|nr:tRNA lysidine(34) synthetase TilS [Ktedonobacteraceae bacterium]
MLERVIACIDRHQLLPERGEIVVAVSGGADSLCLLHLLHRLCGPGKRYPAVSLRAAHLNHMLRGAESARDASVVANIIESWAIPFTSGEIDVIALAKAEKRSLEEAARIARYRFLRGIAKGGRIAVAHHADDQVETLLLHWLRGSGLSGLAGMPPRQHDIIRPLLEITHAQTVAYCQQHGISPLEDQSNRDPRFLRNRIRHEVLPLLQELNPGITHTLLRNAEVVRVDLEWLEAQVDSCWVGVVLSEQEEAITLDIAALLALPLSLQRHVLRRVTARLCEGQSPLEPRHLALIQQLLNGQPAHQERGLDLPQKLRVLRSTNRLIFEHRPSQREEPAPHTSHAAYLPIPGAVQVPGTKWQARADVLPEDLAARAEQALRQENWQEVWQVLELPSSHAVYIDGASAGTYLTVRTRQPGDRIQPLGMPAEKKVQDIFVDNHIPRAERATIPLFFAGERCLWVAGSCLDHRARLTGQTRRIVRLSIHSV